ncbi:MULTISPECIES: hypothetical protein [Sphingobacterium]|uniref:hypothetical protein n=1 Tax=Sphingobacterium TaxID=28453 RepID=UPI00257AAC6E|nr:MULTISPECIES: hypothetical protein [Sphingobacterium]
MEEELRKKIEELNLKETLELADKIALRKKQIDATIAAFKDKKVKINVDKSHLKEAKSKRMKILQEGINKAVDKDSKRKSKARESNSYDSQIASKQREIDSLNKSISELDLEKKQIIVGEQRLKQHIKTLK